MNEQPPAQVSAQRRSAFAAIARSHEPALMRGALRLCRGDHGRAEDLVQETMVRGYQAYADGRFQTGANPLPWLQRILTNHFINDYRRRKRWDSEIDLDELTLGGDAGPASMHAAARDIPGVRLLEQTIDETLERALNMLSDDLRRTVVLVDVEGYEYEEAAKALGVPIGTVRSRLARARMKLHDLLQDFATARASHGAR